MCQCCLNSLCRLLHDNRYVRWHQDCWCGLRRMLFYTTYTLAQMCLCILNSHWQNNILNYSDIGISLMWFHNLFVYHCPADMYCYNLTMNYSKCHNYSIYSQHNTLLLWARHPLSRYKTLRNQINFGYTHWLQNMSQLL